MIDKVYKRMQVKWYEMILSEGDESLKVMFYDYFDSHPYMSKNRCAYNVLKKYYSTTFGSYMAKWILDLARKNRSLNAYKTVLSTEWL